MTALGHNNPPSFREEQNIPPDIQKMHYFKCDIQALRKAIIDKPLDVRGFYISVLLALYEWMEPLPADDATAQMRTGIKDIRIYRRMKETLLALGLIETGTHGHSNPRFESEISDYVTEFKRRRKAALEREEKARIERAKAEIAAQSTPQSPPDYPPQSPPQSAVIKGGIDGSMPPPLNGEVSEKSNKINGHNSTILVEVRSESDHKTAARARVTRDRVRDKEEDSSGARTTRRGTRLPEDWVLPKSWGEEALADYHVSASDVRLEAAKFKNYWTAKTGRDATKANWEATWRNWCLNCKSWRRRINSDPHPAGAPMMFGAIAETDEYTEAWDKARAMLGGDDDA